jgi:hypothetical protein
MAKLTAKSRRSLIKDQFALASQRKYPIPDKNHAVDAKARATQQEDAGNLSAGQKATIEAKANKVIKGKS